VGFVTHEKNLPGAASKNKLRIANAPEKFVVVVVVSLSIQLNPRAQNVSGP